MTIPVGTDEEVAVELYWRKPVVTYTLLLVNVLVFVLLQLTYPVLGFDSYGDLLSSYGTYPYDLVYLPTFYRVFTSMFLHADILHLFGNMLFLFIFGRDVERLMGSLKFLVFYLLSGIVASIFNTLSIAFLPQVALLSRTQLEVIPWFIPAVGASGAISGILGAYFMLFPKTRVLTFFYVLPVLMTAEFYIFMWFIYQLIMGLSLGGVTGVAFWAHIGGFIGGIALLPVFVDLKLVRYLKYRRRRYFIDFWYYLLPATQETHEN